MAKLGVGVLGAGRMGGRQARKLRIALAAARSCRGCRAVLVADETRADGFVTLIDG